MQVLDDHECRLRCIAYVTCLSYSYNTENFECHFFSSVTKSFLSKKFKSTVNLKDIGYLPTYGINMKLYPIKMNY